MAMPISAIQRSRRGLTLDEARRIASNIAKLPKTETRKPRLGENRGWGFWSNGTCTADHEGHQMLHDRTTALSWLCPIGHVIKQKSPTDTPEGTP